MWQHSRTRARTKSSPTQETQQTPVLLDKAFLSLNLNSSDAVDSSAAAECTCTIAVRISLDYKKHVNLRHACNVITVPITQGRH